MGNNIGRCTQRSNGKRYKKSQTQQTTNPAATTNNVSTFCEADVYLKFLLNQHINKQEITFDDLDSIKLSGKQFIAVDKQTNKCIKYEISDILDLYVEQLDSLIKQFSKYECNPSIIKIVCATCFTRDEEYKLIKSLLNNSLNKKKSIKVKVDDLYISSTEALSIEALNLLFDNLKANIDTNDKKRLINKQYLVAYSSNKINLLDSFMQRYTKHFHEVFIGRFGKFDPDYLCEYQQLLQKLIDFGFRMSNYTYSNIFKMNCLFICYNNINDLLVMSDDTKDNKDNVDTKITRKRIETMINIYFQKNLDHIMNLGFRKYSDYYKTMFYYKIKKSCFNDWTDGNKLLISQLISTQAHCPKYQPLNLIDHCRIVIRNNCSNSDLNKLELPRQFLPYLKYKNEVKSDVELFSEMNHAYF